MATDASFDWEKQLLFAIHLVNNSHVTGTYTSHQIFFGRDNAFRVAFRVDMQDLKISPIDNVSALYTEYITNMQNTILHTREKIMSRKEYQRKLQAGRQNEKITLVYIQIRSLAYIWCSPTKSGMYTASRKFAFHYLGPLLVAQLYKDNFVQWTLFRLSYQPLIV